MSLVSRLTHNWTLKLAALGLAVLFWASLRAETFVRRSVPGIPVQVRVEDPDWVLSGRGVPDSATVVFVGPWRELFRVALDRPRITLVVDKVRDSVEIHSLRAAMLHVQGDLGRTRVDEILPSSVRLHFEPVTSRTVPVAVRTVGALPAGYRLVHAMHVEPTRVKVSGSRDRLQRLDSLQLEPIDLSRITAPVTLRMRVAEAEPTSGLIVAPRIVEVFVPVLPLTADSAATDSAQLPAAPAVEDSIR